MSTLCCRWVIAVGLVVFLGGLATRYPVRAQEPPRGSDLPSGAKLRLGSTAILPRHQPLVTLLPPDYKTLLVPDHAIGLRKYDLATAGASDGGPPDSAASSGQIVVSGNGKRSVTATTGVLTIRDVATGQAVQQLKPPRQFSTTFTSPIPVFSFSQDGKYLAQGGQSTGVRGEVVVWDVDKGETVFEASLRHSGPPLPVLSPDGKYLATRASTTQLASKGESGPSVTLWQVEGGKELFTGRLSGTATPVTTVEFSPDGRMVAAACGDGPIDLWEVPSGKLKHTFFGRTGQGQRIAFSPDGKTLAAVASDGTVQRWGVADGKLIATSDGPIDLPLQAAQGLAFVTNDQVLAWGAVGRFPIVWDASSGKVLTPLPEHTASIRSIGFAAGGKEIVTAGQDGRVVRWDAVTGKSLGSVELRPSRALSGFGNRLVVHLSGDGQRAVTVAVPHVVFDLSTGYEEFALPRGLVGNVTTYSAVSADARYVAQFAVPQDPRKPALCIVWDLVARKKLTQLELPPGGSMPPAVAFSPDGHRMVMAHYVSLPGGGQPVLRVTGWDLQSGTKLSQVDDGAAHGAVLVAAASDSQALVASAGGRLRVFNYETGRGGDVFEIVNRSDSLTQLALSPDHKRVAVGVASPQNGGDAIRIHDWPTGRLLHTFTGHPGQVTALIFSPDGQTLVSGSPDGQAFVWDLTVVKN